MMSRNDPESAEHLLKKSLTVKEQLGDVAGSAASLSNLAHIYSHTGRIQEALELYQKAAGIQENIGDRVALVNKLSNIAQLSATLGERSAAAAFLERALSISELIGTPDRAHIAERLAALRAETAR